MQIKQMLPKPFCLFCYNIWQLIHLYIPVVSNVFRYTYSVNMFQHSECLYACTHNSAFGGVDLSDYNNENHRSDDVVVCHTMSHLVPVSFRLGML